MRVVVYYLLCLGPASIWSQTTQGLISGRIIDARTGGVIVQASVVCTHLETRSSTPAAKPDASGYYLCPLLPPGTYSVRAEARGYQPKEIYQVELRVGGRTGLNLELLSTADAGKPGQFDNVFFSNPALAITFYGPDVASSKLTTVSAGAGSDGAGESTVSGVIDSPSLRRLPFAGRDAYTMLVTQPGVTADTSTGRGIGLSVHGQRPTSSNFLLDGLENNNSLVTGPLSTVAPEALQEYRVSTGSYSAEYGRSSGFLANAITRAGQPDWHGIGYLHFNHQRLNANSFAKNAIGLPRSRQREWQTGIQTGGPLRKQSLFFSGAFEYLGSRGLQDAVDILVPSPALRPAGPAAADLLRRFPTPALVPGNGRVSPITVEPAVSVDRYSSLARLDWVSPSTRHRAMARLSASRFSWPNFIWSPYRDFTSGLDNPATSLAGSLVSRWGLKINEAKLGWTYTSLGWDRAHPQIPTLSIQADGRDLRGLPDPTEDVPLILVPSSPALYGFDNRGQGWEFNDNFALIHGRHLFKLGGGAYLRSTSGYLTAARDGRFNFDNLSAFESDSPGSLQIAAQRQTLTTNLTLPDFNQRHRYRQFSLFAQDSFRLTPRLVLNAGLRYENYGSPVNTSATADASVRLGDGNSFPQRLERATLDFAGPRSAYPTDSNNLAARLGFALDAGLGLILRGAYGLFYDRPFDSILQLRNNNYALLTLGYKNSRPLNYYTPAGELLPNYTARDPRGFTGLPQLQLVDPGFRTPYVQTFFLGVQRRLGAQWSLEVNTLGSLGRKLVTTDIVNRNFSNGDLPYNSALPQISYRANQGLSNYNALTALLRYSARRGLLQAAYTWSHTIDNQSDPLLGEFLDLTFVNLARLRPEARRPAASFARQFDSHADRGNADFDQRHNLVVYGHWDLPGARHVTRNWQAGAIAAFRTGFPYSVFGTSRAALQNARANLINPDLAYAGRRPVDGGLLLLNRAGFANSPTTLGNTGRNAFRGAGFYGIDASLSRYFRWNLLGEAGRVTVRSDVFNLLNHANLGTPDNRLPSPTFGQAQFGRSGVGSGFPTLLPLRESPRRIQLLLRFEF